MDKKIQQQFRYAAVVLKSEQAMPVRAMVEQELETCVYYVVRGGSDEQREQLHALIEKEVVCRLALSRGRRQMIICRANEALTDAENIAMHQRILASVFGSNNRISVRFMRRIAL